MTSRASERNGRYVSTGHLPSPRQVQAAIDEAYEKYRQETSGENSQTYPALAGVPGDLFGICVAGVTGSIYRAGDTGHEFTVMSVAKPFTFALVCDVLGDEQVRQALGVNATGLAFDSVAAVERSPDGRSNPMVNAGAIAAVSLVPGDSSAAKWLFIAEGLSRFAGRDLALSEEVYASAAAANQRNRAIANYLASRGRIYCDPGEAVDLYTRQSCLLTSAEDLAVMSATLADGGGQSGERAAGGHPGRLPACARGHGHRRDVPDLWRLAFRRRGAGEERDRRRDRGRLARQGRPGDVLPAPGPGREQRPGSAGGQASFQNTRIEPVRIQGAGIPSIRQLTCGPVFTGCPASPADGPPGHRYLPGASQRRASAGPGHRSALR